MANKKKLVPIAVLVGLMIFSLIVTNHILSKNKNISHNQNITDSNSTKLMDESIKASVVSKVLVTNSEQSAAQIIASSLPKKIEKIASDKQGTYGVYAIDLTTGKTYGRAESDDFIAASTVKVPINLYLYDQVAKGNISLDETMTYTDADSEGGTGSIQYERVGSRYTIRELSKRSIEESDNVAVNMLIRRLGYDRIHDFEEQIVGHPVNRTQNSSCPKDMALYLQYLLNYEKQHPSEGEQMINYLENTIFNDRINLYLPAGVKVAHKIGSQVGAIHDIGIVYADKPFIVAVMSKNANESQAPDTIGRIAKAVYDAVENGSL